MRLAAVEDVLSRRTVDGVVLLRVQGGEPVVVTGGGATLWNLLERGIVGQQEAASAVAATYAAPPELVAEELGEVIDDLQRRGFLVRRCTR